MEIQSIFINACITVLSLGILILSIIGYKKTKNNKLIFVSTAFLIFFIKGLFLSIGLFNDQLAVINANSYFGLFDVLILTILFISTLKR